MLRQVLIATGVSCAAAVVALAHGAHASPHSVTSGGRLGTRGVERPYAVPPPPGPSASQEFELNPSPIEEPSAAASAAIATNGTNVLVVWQTSAQAWETRVAPDGSLFDPAGSLVSDNTAATALSGPAAVVSLGGTYLVAQTGVPPASAVGQVLVSPLTADGAATEAPVPLGDADARTAPAMATDGTHALIAALSGDDSKIALFVVDGNGALVSQGSLPWDPSPFVFPSVAWNGSEYLVTWSAAVACPTADCDGGTPDSPLMAARVGADGTVIDTTPIQVVAPFPSHGAVTGSDGSNFVMAWSALDGSVSALRLGPSGAILDSSPIAVSAGSAGDAATAGSYDTPSVSFDGTDYVFAYSSGTTLLAQRMSPLGVLLDGAGVPLDTASDSSASPAAVSLAGTTYVAWTRPEPERASSGVPAEAWVARVAAGVRVGSSIDVSRAANAQHTPVAAFGGGGYAAAWVDDRWLPDGGASPGVMATAPIPEDGGSCANLVLGCTVDPKGVALSQGEAADELPAIASDGQNYLVTWVRTAGASQLVGKRLSAGERVLDSASIAIASSPQSSPIVASALAFAGGVYLDAYSDGASVLGVRLGMDGAVLDPTPIVISAQATVRRGGVTLASDGTTFFAGWDGGNVAQITPAGTLVAVTAGIDSARGGAPSLACQAGVGCLAAWRLDYATPACMAIARIATDGGVLDVRPIALGSRTGQPALMPRPALAWIEGVYLAAWTEGASPLEAQIVGVQIPADRTAATSYFALPSGDRTAVPSLAIATDGVHNALAVAEKLDPTAPYGADRARGWYLSPWIGVDAAAFETVDGASPALEGRDSGTASAGGASLDASVATSSADASFARDEGEVGCACHAAGGSAPAGSRVPALGALAGILGLCLRSVRRTSVRRRARRAPPSPRVAATAGERRRAPSCSR